MDCQIRHQLNMLKLAETELYQKVPMNQGCQSEESQYFMGVAHPCDYQHYHLPNTEPRCTSKSQSCDDNVTYILCV